MVQNYLLPTCVLLLEYMRTTSLMVQNYMVPICVLLCTATCGYLTTYLPL